MPKRKTIVAIAALLLAAGGAMADITIETVPVGNPGNAPDTRFDDNGFGAVPYTYNIGKYEVTAGQYCEFLNRVAGVDTYDLYKFPYDPDPEYCQITRGGEGTLADPYTYGVAQDYANRPVNGVSWGDAARFANWLHNGQPTGAQDLTTTEDGAYHLDGAITDATLLAVSREADWEWAITSEDEWYKAAYYDPAKPGGPGYWDYPTGANIAPGRDMADAFGNNANYYEGSGGSYPIDSGKYYTTLVGEFQNSDSPYGTFDQGGNVREWNDAVFGAYRMLRGGAYNGSDGDGLAAWECGFAHPTHVYFGVGFRVSQVPEPAHPGDANSDRAVDVGDLGILAFNWGKSGMSWAQANFTTPDTTVDVGDLGVLASNWGWVGSPTGVGSVPEPATMSLLALGVAALVRRRRMA